MFGTVRLRTCRDSAHLQVEASEVQAGWQRRAVSSQRLPPAIFEMAGDDRSVVDAILCQDMADDVIESVTDDHLEHVSFRTGRRRI